MWGWLAAAAGGLVALVLWAQYRAQRGQYRSLASRQPPRPKATERPLGLEAVDLEAVARASRRNESYERGTTNWLRSRMGFFGAAVDTRVEPWADDETYAARYHAAFLKDKAKDK